MWSERKETIQLREDLLTSQALFNSLRDEKDKPNSENLVSIVNSELMFTVIRNIDFDLFFRRLRILRKLTLRATQEQVPPQNQQNG